MAVWTFLAQLAATLYMTGLIWMVQVVHYPLFAKVGADAFPAYHHLHVARISPVVMVPMLVELGAAALLLADRPSWMPAWAAGVGVALIAVAWGSTFFFSVPAHDALGRGLDPAAVQRLVATNWIRLAAWTARSGLLLWLLARALRP